MATPTSNMSAKTSVANTSVRKTTNHKEVSGRVSTDSFKSQLGPRNPRGSNSSNRGA